MSFSLTIIDLDWPTILAGEGPLKDVFASFTIDGLLVYVGTWITFIKGIAILQWAIMVFAIYLGIRFALNLIPAFNSKEDGLGPD